MMKIRKFQEKDADRCSKIIMDNAARMKLSKQGRGYLKKDSPEGLIKYSKQYYICVYEDKGKIQGLGRLNIKKGKIGLMFVNFKQQRKGIGKTILLYLENLAKKKGRKKVRLNAVKGAIGFYKKFGYKKITKVNIDCYKMEKVFK